MNKVLVILPDKYDIVETSKLDQSHYEVHVLYPSDKATTENMSQFDYKTFYAQSGFLTSYVDRAVSYVQEHKITSIMFGHDMASVVASVVCEKTGLRGPTLESTFRSLHKYYSRVTDRTEMWFDFIDLDQPANMWKDKVRYPCFLKAPFLFESKGHSRIHNEDEMLHALGKLKEFISPFFTGYSNFFKKYLDLNKFPLAVENIVLVEELVQNGQVCAIHGWVDAKADYTLSWTNVELSSHKRSEITMAYVVPSFILDESSVEKLVKFAEETVQHFGLCNTFVDIEVWKRGGKLTLVEVNSRAVTLLSAGYKKMWGVSAYELVVYLACGELEKLRKFIPRMNHQDGEPIVGYFIVPTLNEGKLRDLINYDYAINGCIVDGAFNNMGPGMSVDFNEDSIVQQISSNGVKLASFMLTNKNKSSLLEHAKRIMKKVLLQPRDLDLLQF